MSSLWRRYIKDERGNFAVTFALLGLPLVVASTFVMDYAGAGSEKVKIKSALDAAVIAAVNNNTLSMDEKEAYATKHFQENYDGDIVFELKPKASETRVEMSAFGVAPVTVADTLGIDGIEIFEKSMAVQTSENVICALSTAPDGQDRITFKGNSSFTAPTCSVHANSDDARAMRVLESARAHAKNFCTVGGSSGSFQPYAKGDCAPVADPYANRRAPEPGPCINIGQIRDLLSLHGLGPNEENNIGEPGGMSITTQGLDGLDDGNGGSGGGPGGAGGIVENLTGSNTTLSAGTYCGGLTVDGRNVTFGPGNHIMLGGPLIFRNNAQATGDGVTFVMNGLPSVLTVESGAAVDIVAPKRGDLAGLAFFQDVQTQLGAAGIFPNGVNSMTSGGELNITGTAYFPTQTVEVTSNAVFGSRAPATSFIAYDIHFDGASTINVAVDHQRAGLPPIMPRTEDGARLAE